jgi:Domain of unknown function (DUF4352)
VVRTFFGALGIIALFVAIVVGMLAAFGAFGEKAPQGLQAGGFGGERTTAAQTKQAERSTNSIGQTVTTGDLSWIVTDAHQATEIHKQTWPPKTQGGNFVVVAFTVENVSDKPVTLTAGSMSVLSNDGQKLPAEARYNSDYVEDEKNILFNERSLLQPGETREGEVNFALPLGASATIVQLEDNDPTANKEQYVDLGL